MNVYEEIKKDNQIKKFCLYGLLKNLQFFEPYLLLYLISLGYDLFHIGILFAIRGAATYLFEVPSAIFADYYGKKSELMICFLFYIAAFVLFFSAANHLIIALAMAFYGLGEAFRSGTHKAMILSYLEQQGWYQQRGFVYGWTRSFSLLGSSLSAFLSIIFALKFPVLKWLFVISTAPYLLDFMLIASYPTSLNEKRAKVFNFRHFMALTKIQLKVIAQNISIRKIVASGASYHAVFKTIKDYIQPILSTMLIISGVGLIIGLNQNESLKIYLGIIYGIFYIFSSVVSKNIYRVSNKYGDNKVFYRLYDLMAILLLILAFTIKHNLLLLTVLLYFVLYLIQDARRPVFVEVLSSHMKKTQRVTVLSIESQVRALLIIIFGPLFGYIAEIFSLSGLFLTIGITLLMANRFWELKPQE